MKKWSTRIALSIALLAFGSCAAPMKVSMASDASPPSSPRSALIEVVDSAQGKPVRTSRYALSAVDGQEWSRVESDFGNEVTHVQVKASRDRDGYGVVINVEVQRSDRSRPGNLSATGSTKFFSGRKTIISKIERTDGTSTEVALAVN